MILSYMKNFDFIIIIKFFFFFFTIEAIYLLGKNEN